jgi:hypothetical protein
LSFQLDTLNFVPLGGAGADPEKVSRFIAVAVSQKQYGRSPGAGVWLIAPKAGG